MAQQGERETELSERVAMGVREERERENVRETEKISLHLFLVFILKLLILNTKYSLFNTFISLFNFLSSSLTFFNLLKHPLFNDFD